jgi:dipeptidyl aminopeptidase/acylaminoacyl peptidase
MALPPLIPRSVLFGPPARVHPALSPSARRIAFLAPVDGVSNLWVETVGTNDARPLTGLGGAGVLAFDWAQDGRHLLYPMDNDGDERSHLYAVDTITGATTDLTPYDGIRARFLGVTAARPHHVLFAMNRRKPDLFDAYVTDLRTGVPELAAENPGFAGWYHDHELKVSGAFRWQDDGGLTLLVRDGTDWRALHAADGDDANTTRLVGFTADGTGVTGLTSVGTNTVCLRRWDLRTGASELLYADPDYDVGSVGLSPLTGEADVVVVEGERRELTAVDPAVVPDVARLREACAGDAILLSRDPSDRKWLVMDYVDNGPARYHVYHRPTGSMRFLFSHNPVLEQYELARLEPFSFPARDGLIVHGYLAFPPGVPRRQLPAVLAVHGGPWTRDQWGSGGDAQWLANRGYLCVQVNYRGSTGYGKDFVNAGDREWGGRMQDDLVDAAESLVSRGIVDPARLAIYGSSYGGYAALVGAAFTPGLFRCAIAVCAPSDLRTFVRAAIDSAGQLTPRIRRRIGDPVADADFLWLRSPLSRVDEIRVPILVAHGANDPRVPVSEAEQLVVALRDNGIDHEFLCFPDEGHGFVKPGNQMRFYAVAERFLARHLGGRHELSSF